MPSYRMTPQSKHLKLVPQSLMPDESISSLVDRQAQLWGVSRKELVYQAAFISGLIAHKDLDVCKADDFLDIYARKTGIDRRLLESHRAQISRPLVSPGLRYAYCPMCFHEDASAGHTPYFRLDWARIFLTHCQRHGCPLFRWLCVSPDSTRKLPHGWFVGEGPDQRSIPQFRRDLMLARAYAYGVRPRSPTSIKAWNTLKDFEAWLYQIAAGAPFFRTVEGHVGLIERDVMDRAVTLARSATANGRLLVEESDAILFEDQRVMSFAFKVARVRESNPAWRDLRSGIQSIACRRAVLHAVAREYRYGG